jgi:hypothetical protein
MLVELIVGVGFGYIPCELVLFLFFCVHSSLEDVDNFGQDIALRECVWSTNKDRLAHLGGFLMGLLVGTTFYPVISTTRRHKLITWCFRLVAIPLAIILYVVLARNFYTADPYAGEPSTHKHTTVKSTFS